MSRSAVGARWLTRAATALGLAGLAAAARTGPDGEHYLEWARAAGSADIFQLPGLTLSPFGVPFSLWSHGTGFLFAASRTLSGHLASERQSALAIGWLAAVVFWSSMYRLLANVARGCGWLTLLGMALVFAATPAGFYSFSYASESFSLACLAVVAYWLVVPRLWRRVDAFVLGAACGVLIIVRAQLALYVVVALGAFLHHLRGSPGRRLVLLACAAIPFAAAVAQVLIVDRWMTGLLLGSPYAYGARGFRSLDFRHPEVGAVLLHPWHGLLVYHPLYAVCFVALCASWGAADSPARRALCVALIVLLLGQLYLQAAHFAWWLGWGTFGMRALAPAAVILVPLLIDHLARRRVAGAANRVWLLAAAACALWSYLLLRQGETNFMSYGQLLAAQHTQLGREVTAGRLFPLLVAGGVAWVVAGGRRGDLLFSSTAVLASSLAALGLMSEVTDRFQLAARLGLPATVLVESALVALPPLAIGRGSTDRPRGILLRYGVAIGLLLVFLVENLSFARLAVRTETLDAEAARAGRRFLYRGALDWGELQATYQEYLRVPGFDEKKARLRAFLDAWAATHSM